MQKNEKITLYKEVPVPIDGDKGARLCVDLYGIPKEYRKRVEEAFDCFLNDVEKILEEIQSF